MAVPASNEVVYASQNDSSVAPDRRGGRPRSLLQPIDDVGAAGLAELRHAGTAESHAVAFVRPTVVRSAVAVIRSAVIRTALTVVRFAFGRPPIPAFGVAFVGITVAVVGGSVLGFAFAGFPVREHTGYAGLADAGLARQQFTERLERFRQRLAVGRRQRSGRSG